MSAEPAYYLPLNPRRAPKWVVGSVDEYLDQQRMRRFNTALEPIRFQPENPITGHPVIEGRMMEYNAWTTIRTPDENDGRPFLERFAPGAFREQIRAGIRDVRLLYDHGQDKQFGRLPIAAITEMTDRPDGAYYRGELLDGVPELLVSGLRAGLMGASVRFSAVEAQRERFPRRSEHNPAGWPEQTILEARLREVSVTPFPSYRGTSAEIVTATIDAPA
jgi:HK97 family phage prohead protease